MQMINGSTQQQKRFSGSVTTTRRLIGDAKAGRISLLELEKLELAEKEVAQFLIQQIPLLRAVAIGGGMGCLGMFLEEIFYALAKKANLSADDLPSTNVAAA